MKVWIAINRDDPLDFHIETEAGREVPVNEAVAEYDGDLVLIGPLELGEDT